MRNMNVAEMGYLRVSQRVSARAGVKVVVVRESCWGGGGVGYRPPCCCRFSGGDGGDRCEEMRGAGYAHETTPAAGRIAEKVENYPEWVTPKSETKFTTFSK